MRDAGLITAARKVEHYEIAGYGTVRTYAELLGEEDAMQTLNTTLDEEGAIDEKLTELAGIFKVSANAEEAKAA